VTESVPAWLYGVAIVTAIAGTRLGTRLLERFSDTYVRTVGSAVILAIAALCFIKGAYGFMSGY
jgi:uncharacterized membrane protein YfcA